MQLTPEQVNILIERNRRIAGYEYNCDCGQAITVEQPDLFGQSKAIVRYATTN